MDLDFTQFAELIDIRPKQGSHFIHSMSEPFSEENIEDEVMHNWNQAFPLGNSDCLFNIEALFI